MTFVEFERILTQEGLSRGKIKDLWDTRPPGDLNEERLRMAARLMKKAETS